MSLGIIISSNSSCCCCSNSNSNNQQTARQQHWQQITLLPDQSSTFQQQPTDNCCQALLTIQLCAETHRHDSNTDEDGGNTPTAKRERDFSRLELPSFYSYTKFVRAATRPKHSRATAQGAQRAGGRGLIATEKSCLWHCVNFIPFAHFDDFDEFINKKQPRHTGGSRGGRGGCPMASV